MDPSEDQGSDEAPTPDQITALDPLERVSCYVQVWEELISTVLDKESYLFTPLELQAIQEWSNLSYPARYLYVRLFIRKSGFVRLSKLSYERDIPDLQSAVKELCRPQPLGQRVLVIQDSPRPSQEAFASKSTRLIEDVPEDTLGRFALDETPLVARANVNELCGMLAVEELKSIAKDFKVSLPRSKDGKPGIWTRESIIQELKKQTNNQTTLFSMCANSKTSKKGKKPAWSQTKNAPQNQILIKKLLQKIGPAIMLDKSTACLFQRLHLIFHRCQPPQNANSLTAALLARFEKWTYPAYAISRSFAIFPSRAILLRFEGALCLENEMEEALGLPSLPRASSPGTQKTHKAGELRQQKRACQRQSKWKRVLDIFDRAWPLWLTCIEDFDKQESDTEAPKDDRLAYYRKRFHPGWPLTRVVHKGSAAFAALKQFDREVNVLLALLGQLHFRRGRRGQWWDRLALIHMEHGVNKGVPTEVALDDDDDIIEIQPNTPSQRECRNTALQICWDGLADPWTSLVERHALQRRIIRLQSLLKVPKPKRHVFTEHLNKATDIEIEGVIVGERVVGRKSIWKSTIDGEPNVSVEDLCLEHYRAAGWKGHHAENSVLTTLFGLLFFDILFAPVDGAFETAYQSSPLDLATDAFRIMRANLIAARLSELEADGASAILKEVDARERPRTTKIVGVRWSFTAEELQEFAQCMGGQALSVICRVYAEDYEHRVGGVPDLFLWKPAKTRCKFVEVKGPGDQLSKTQKVWIDVLLSAGLKVEKCSVKAKGKVKRKSEGGQAQSTPMKRTKSE